MCNSFQVSLPRDAQPYLLEMVSRIWAHVNRSVVAHGVLPLCFHVNLIPQTPAVTTFGARMVGARVNLQVDLVATYVARLHVA